MGLSQISFFFHNTWRPPQISFIAYYMEAQISFFHLLYGASLRLVSALTIWVPLRSVFVHIIWGLPQINFFAYYMGAIALRSVSSYSIWGPLQISFFTYNMEAPSDLFLCILYGGPFGSVSLLTIRAPAPQVSFFAYYIWSPLIFIQFLRVKLSLGGAPYV